MQIVELYIENFGKLHDLKLKFSNGLNVICENNGFGKTTLSNFIIAMFFGFQGERKRAIRENIRKKYVSWQGGTYGGYIIFIQNQKKYILERSFGIKNSKEDTFTLYDADTMLKSKAYTSNIGEEIFKIDRESFAKTAFIGQLGIKTSATSSINAKMGNLAEEIADLSSFEVVEKKIKDTLNQMSPTRKTGEISKLSTAIASIANKIQSESTKRGLLQELKKQRANYEIKKMALECEQSNLQQRINKISRQKDELQSLIKEKQSYDDLKRNVEEATKKVETSKTYFSKNVPTMELVNEAIEINEEYVSLIKIIKDSKLSELDLQKLENLRCYFSKEIPSGEDIKKSQEFLQSIAELKSRINKEDLSQKELEKFTLLDEKFSYVQVDENVEIELQNIYETILNSENLEINSNNKKASRVSATKNLEDIQEEIKRDKKTLEEQKMLLEATSNRQIDSHSRDSKSIGLPYLIGGLFCFVVGIIGLIVTMPLIVTIGFIAIGGILILIPVNGNKNNIKIKNNNSPDVTASARRLTDGTKNALKEKEEKEIGLQRKIKLLDEEIEEIEASIQRNQDKINEFCIKSNIKQNSPNLSELLYRMKLDWDEFVKIKTIKEQYAQNEYESKLSKIRDELKKLLSKFIQADITSNFEEAAQKFPHDMEAYQRLSNQELNRMQNFIQREEKRKKILDFFDYCGFEVNQQETSYRFDLSKIQTALIQLINNIKHLNDKKSKLETTDFSRIMEAETIQEKIEEESIEEVNQKIQVLQKDLKDSNDRIHGIDSQITELKDELDEIEEYKKQQDELQDKKQKLIHRYKILSQTIDLLTEAKNLFAVRYMAPFKNAFYKYYKMIDDSEDKEYVIDTELNVSIKEQGLNREIDFLSTGYQDLVNLCSRMAMLDSMYGEEKPMLLMDEPFANFDDRKHEKAIEFLKKVSEQYQIIYFSCRKIA